VARRGRPRSARAASAILVRVKLRLYPGEDDDLIAFFNEIAPGNRAATVKGALRSRVSASASNPSSDDEDILASLASFVL